MCLSPPAAVFEAIIANPTTPRAIKDAAAVELQQSGFQALVNEATASSKVKPISLQNEDFTCTIFNLHNKVPHNKDTHGPLDKLKSHVNAAALVELPGQLLEDTATKFAVCKPDAAHQMAIKGLRVVYDFYKDHFGRNSLNDEGMELRASIHCSRGYNNAYWSTSQKQMVFGDGGRFDGRFWMTPSTEMLEEHDRLMAKHAQDLEDGTAKRDEPFERLLPPSEDGRFQLLQNHLFAYHLDVVAHELTHGVVAYTAELGKQQDKVAASEAKTLNEHIADCFAVMVKHSVDNHTAQSGSWDLAPGTWAPYWVRHMGWSADYMRTFRNPDSATENSPDEMPKVWKWTYLDLWPFQDSDRKGFVILDGKGRAKGLDPHTLCGIPNHAFYLAALEFGGHIWDTVGKIWYAALVDVEFKDPKNQTFYGWKRLTIQHAANIFGDSGIDIMTRAWNGVGMGPDFDAMCERRLD